MEMALKFTDPLSFGELITDAWMVCNLWMVCDHFPQGRVVQKASIYVSSKVFVGKLAFSNAQDLCRKSVQR